MARKRGHLEIHPSITAERIADAIARRESCGAEELLFML